MSFLGFTSTRLGSEVSCLRTLPRKNPEDPVRLEPRIPGLRVKHFTTEPRGTQVGVNSGNNLVCAEDGVSVGVDGLLVGDSTAGVGGIIVLNSVVEDRIVERDWSQKGPLPKRPSSEMARLVPKLPISKTAHFLLDYCL